MENLSGFLRASERFNQGVFRGLVVTRDNIFYIERVERDLNNGIDSSAVKQPSVRNMHFRIIFLSPPPVPRSKFVELANSESVRIGVFDVNFARNRRDKETLAIMYKTVKDRS